MSSATRRAKQPEAKQPGDDARGGAGERGVGGAWRALALVAVLAGIPFVLGKYFELSTPDPYDGAANIYSAQRILDGARIGVDERPSAQLGTLAVNVLGVAVGGYNETGAKVIQGLLQAAALVVMFVVFRRVFGVWAAGVSVVSASLLLSCPLIAKFGNVKEQYMIACMMLGICLLIRRHDGGRWWTAALAGAALVWAPLFKPTGVSAVAAAGIFLLAQPLLKHRTWRQTGQDVGLMLAGGALALAPACVWLAAIHAPAGAYPYSIVWARFLPSSGAGGGGDYVGDAWAVIATSEVAARYFRYVDKLILPVLLALAALAARLARLGSGLGRPAEGRPPARPYERFVLLLGLWWLADSALVWVSPRLFEQYFLPMTASGSALGAYAIALWDDGRRRSENRLLWNAAGFAGLCAMVILSYHIVFGIRFSPHSGTEYGGRSRGYVQKWDEVGAGGRSDWRSAGQYIRDHSNPRDKMYVWGWYPGIYVEAQRVAPTPGAFTSEMYVMSPQALSKMVRDLVADFEKDPPRFIVDSRKLDFPWRGPLLELWPVVPDPSGRGGQLLPNDPKAIAEYEAGWGKVLAEKVGPAEAERFGAMKPLRDYVMGRYEVVREPWAHLVFKARGK